MFGPKKMLGSKKNLGQNFFFGKHHLCVTSRFLVGSVVVYLGGVLLFVLVLLVTWVNRTQAPKLSQKPTRGGGTEKCTIFGTDTQTHIEVHI